MSIFKCSAFTIFSNGGTVDMGGGWKTVEIPAPKIHLGDMSVPGTTTNSWLNTLIFMEAWTLIKDDGRFREHDWTVKVDPDAVFFPERLANIVQKHAQTGGPGLFFMNCDRYDRVALYGSIEIYSRQAIETYFEGETRCKTELQWHGWGEDYFMQICLSTLGVGTVNNFRLIGDKRCHPAPCSDRTKVAFHDFKNSEKWFECWNESQNESQDIQLYQ